MRMKRQKKKNEMKNKTCYISYSFIEHKRKKLDTRS